MLAVVLLAAGAAVAGRPSGAAAGQDPAAATEFADELRQKVTPTRMMAHLGKLQEIADANDGNRALGTPGYDASVDYVANALRDKGFDVQTPEFEVRIPWADAPSLTVGGRQGRGQADGVHHRDRRREACRGRWCCPRRGHSGVHGR